ncbi:hypothetical protein HJG60_011351 [Phyllostomus discolor]|uniref:Uncharacterized protein n=1 Tax=Phyllostomus discolor TaxID=89673 RepID=A0A834A7S0_9CHIR|nr:hypothetical protein HJG60_011351 [Phyllostomus discolor]
MCVESPEALPELGNSPTGSPKGNPTLPWFCNTTLPSVLHSKSEGTVFHSCPSQSFCLCYLFPGVQQQVQIGTHKLEENPCSSDLLNKSQQLLPGLITESAQQLHPVGQLCHVTAVRLVGPSLVWVAAFALLVLQMTSSQEETKDHMEIFSYCNTCSLNKGSRT